MTANTQLDQVHCCCVELLLLKKITMHSIENKQVEQRGNSDGRCNYSITGSVSEDERSDCGYEKRRMKSKKEKKWLSAKSEHNRSTYFHPIFNKLKAFLHLHSEP